MPKPQKRPPKKFRPLRSAATFAYDYPDHELTDVEIEDVQGPLIEPAQDASGATSTSAAR